jgi:TonB family protein
MIAYAMLYTAAVGIPVALAALAIAAILRRHGKPERLVWVGALVTAFVLPAVALLDPFGGAPAATPVPETGVIGLPAVVVVPSEGPSIEWGQLLVAAWLLASVALAIRWAVAVIRLARASRSWQAGTLDGVPVWRTEKLGPAVAGTLQPRVLVPRWLDSLPGSQRRLVLLHEQEHIRARDPLLIAFARAARVLAPWNPAVWLLTARLVRAVELDCDRRVLRRNADVAAYGHTLLTVSERQPGRLAAVAAFAESEAPLRSRILAMTTPSRTISVVALLTSMVLGVVLMVGALEIPVPTLSIQIGVEAAGAAAANQGEAARGAGVTPQTDRPVGAGDQQIVERTYDDRATADRANAEAPPSASEAIGSLREDAELAGETRRSRALVGSDGAARRVEVDPAISERPTFTPFTVAPSILNRDEVVRAMVANYPALLRDAGVGGTVRVYFFIDETGFVRDTRIDVSSGHPALDDGALAVADVFRFSPALNRDQPTPVWVSFPITFQVR